MSRTYKATGINLKSMPLGEADRLLTILTREFGLIRAVAPGARKCKSSLSGRSELFVVNELLIAKGRSLDKITQAESLESYPRLSQDLLKLAASQYLAEMVLCQALSEQPQEELFCLLNEHLSRLERLPKTRGDLVLAHLTHAVFHLLALGGITPQVQVCCLTQHPLTPDFTDPDWRVGFNVPAGGTVSLQALERLQAEGQRPKSERQSSTITNKPAAYTVSSGVAAQNVTSSKRGIVEAKGGEGTMPPYCCAEPTGTSYQTVVHRQEIPVLNTYLNATELALLQQLAGAELIQIDAFVTNQPFSLENTWLFIERILRQYVQYHLGRPIRSAALIDSYFACMPTSSMEP